MPDPTTTDAPAPVKPLDVAKDVPAPAAAAANTEASAKGLTEVQTAISGPATIGTDGQPKIADKTDPTSGEHEHDGIAAAALEAYDPKTVAPKSSPHGDAHTPTEPASYLLERPRNQIPTQAKLGLAAAR